MWRYVFELLTKIFMPKLDRRPEGRFICLESQEVRSSHGVTTLNAQNSPKLAILYSSFVKICTSEVKLIISFFNIIILLKFPGSD